MLHENIISIRDENAMGDVYHELKISFANPKVSIRDIIAERVRIEVDAYNERTPDHIRSLIQPTDAEETLNGYKMKQKRRVDAEKQINVALKAFEQNGFFMLLNDRQAETLDEIVEITDDLEISFVKLTPLVGG